MIVRRSMGFSIDAIIRSVLTAVLSFAGALLRMSELARASNRALSSVYAVPEVVLVAPPPLENHQELGEALATSIAELLE